MLSNLPLLSIGILFLFAIMLIAVRFWRPGFGYSWLITAFGTLIVWALILLSRINLPKTIPLGIWSLPGLTSTKAVLLLDDVSWSYAFGLATLLLAVILTDVARAQESDRSAWTASLIFVALGLLAVLAGNPLTMILAWAAVDFAELLVMFWHVPSSSGRERIALAFSAKVASIFLLLWAWILAGEFGSNATFDEIPNRVSIYLLVAAWIRLGVIPLNLPQIQEQPVRRGLGTLLRLVSAATGLVLLARTARLGTATWQAPYLLALAGFAALYGGISWLYSKDEFEGQPYWIIGVAALALAAAVRGEEYASLAWGLTGLLSGGLLFLFSIRGRFLAILPAIGLLQFSSLPFTQTWNGAGLYSPPLSLWLLFFIVTQAMLLAGYFRRWRVQGQILPGIERWVILIYAWGLALIPIAQLLLAGWGNFTDGEWITPITLATLWPSVLVIGLATSLTLLLNLEARVPSRGQNILGTIFSLDWIYLLIGRVYQVLGRGVALATLVLEGEGGILWALLWLVLLFALIAQGVFRGV